MQRINLGPGVSRLYEANLGKICIKTGSRTKPPAPVPVKRGGKARDRRLLTGAKNIESSLTHY